MIVFIYRYITHLKEQWPVRVLYSSCNQTEPQAAADMTVEVMLNELDDQNSAAASCSPSSRVSQAVWGIVEVKNC